MLQAISCNQGNMNHCIDLLAVIVIFFPANLSQTVTFLSVKSMLLNCSLKESHKSQMSHGDAPSTSVLAAETQHDSQHIC